MALDAAMAVPSQRSLHIALWLNREQTSHFAIRDLRLRLRRLVGMCVCDVDRGWAMGDGWMLPWRPARPDGEDAKVQHYDSRYRGMRFGQGRRRQ
jgi:hypothetical protein